VTLVPTLEWLSKAQVQPPENKTRKKKRKEKREIKSSLSLIYFSTSKE
jgi:hypothetical protein